MIKILVYISFSDANILPNYLEPIQNYTYLESASWAELESEV